MVATVKKKATETEKQRAKANPFEYLGEVKTEFKKITWTTQDELKAYTKIVVAATFIFGLVIYGTDLFIQGCLGMLEWALGGG